MFPLATIKQSIIHKPLDVGINLVSLDWLAWVTVILPWRGSGAAKSFSSLSSSMALTGAYKPGGENSLFLGSPPGKRDCRWAVLVS